jgi:CBS domain-containing protein
VSPRSVTDPLLREAHVLRVDDTVREAVGRLLDSDLPALPVAGGDGRFCGIFGEREFLTALFPGYLTELKHAGFVPRSVEDALRKRSNCRDDPVRNYMTTEHIDVSPEFSDAQVAEIFLHHRVLLVPVVDDGRIIGVITRAAFFRAVAQRFVGGG